MQKKLLCWLMLFLFFMPGSVFAGHKVPAFIVVPFLQSTTLANGSSTDVIIVVQNNTSVNQTITNIFPRIPAGSSVTGSILDDNCGFLSPGDTCEITVQLQGLEKQGNQNLNISVCSFNGALCSQILTPITVKNAPLTGIFVFPTNPSISPGTTQQFYAAGLYSDNTIQNLTKTVTWSSSDPSKATISNVTSTKGLATGIAAGVSTITAAFKGITGATLLTVNGVTLTSITVTPVNTSLANGKSRQFTAVGIYSDNSHQNLTSLVTWGSSNPAIATISNLSTDKGEATGKSVGATTISATLGAVSGSTTLNVTPAVLTSISVTPTNPSSAKGTTRQFTATGIYSDHSTNDLTTKVKWNTASASIAIVSNHDGSQGIALAVSLGTTAVTATLDGIVGSTNFTVTPAVLSSIDVSPTNKTIAAGEKQQYTATGIYTDHSTQDLTTTATWLSSNPSVATVSNTSGSRGLATGVAVGTVTISASQSGVTGNTSLTVDPAALASIAVTPTTPSIANGTQLQFTATGTYTDASTKDLTTLATWISSSPSIAIISNADGSRGLATGVSVGGSSIIAAFSGISGNTPLTVTPAILTSIAVTPANATIPEKTTEQFTATGTYSDFTTKVITNEVTWNSSNTAKATVSNATGTKGLVTGVSNGSTNISALLSGITGSTPLTIINVSIGDNLDGGIVACLDGGLNDLIAATADNASGIIWGGSGTTTNAQSATNGTTNTNTIVSVLGAGTTYAAGLCHAYEIDSAGNSPCVIGNTCYNDWFLPSTNQLSCMNKNQNKVGGFSKVPYWSSTEYSAAPSTQAYYISFSKTNNSPVAGNKTNAYRVRCARLMSASF